MLSGTETPVRANLYFVLPSGCKDEDETEEEMKTAFQESEEAGLAPRWVSEAKCMKKVGAKNDVYVLPKFEGELFSKLCKSKSGRVVGPKCLRTCILEGQPIPETGSPVFTTAMRNLIITATQITAERKVEIKKMVGYMGGHYTNNLVESVTHLVTNVVRSAKYEKASEQGIPVMVEAWINNVWEASLTRNVRATDPEFEKYKCPIFLDMYITCSNLKRGEKEQMKELITKHGGIFTPYLRQQETCLMVIKEPHGEKYKSAQAWGLPCVYPSWVLESVEKGYAVPSAKHLLMPKLKASTPTTKGETQETANFTCSSDASISIIQRDTDNKSQVDESALSNATVTQQTHTQQVAQLSQPRSVRSQKKDKEYKQVLSSIAIPQAKRAGPFLDGYRISLSGFTSMETERLRRILSLGGATVFSSLTESVTHVIVGDFVPADAKAVISSGLRPHVVKLEWLSASIKQKGAADEEQYTYPDFGKTVPEPPSPLSQKVLQMLQPQEKQQGNITACLPIKDTALSRPRKLFKDFVNEANRDASGSQKDPGPSVSVNMNQNLAPPDASVNDYSSQSQSQSLNCSEMFKGLLFLLIDLDPESEETVQSLITTCGGTIVARSFKGIADYAIVPLDGTSVNITATEIVTDLWLVLVLVATNLNWLFRQGRDIGCMSGFVVLGSREKSSKVMHVLLPSSDPEEDCFESCQVVPIQYYHQPLSVDKDKMPLKDCCLGFSSYTGREKIFLARLAQHMGAIYQDVLARKNNEANNIVMSTHLVCPVESGSKYSAAKKWGLPIVTKDWLLACAKYGTKADESQYFLTDKTALQKSSHMKPPETPLSQIYGRQQSSSTSASPFIPPETPAKSQMNIMPEAVNKSQTPVGSGSEFVMKRVSETGSTGATPQTLPPDVLHAQPLTPTARTPLCGTAGTKRKSEAVNCSPYLQDSPFHVSTPESPYGQVFVTPTSETKKRWKKWIDSFPDFKGENPPLAPKQRRNSTPYSELRKRVYAKFLGVKYDDFDVDPVTGDVKDTSVSDSEGAASQSFKNRSSYLHKIAKDMSVTSDTDSSAGSSSKSHNTSLKTSEKGTSEAENEKQIASNMISSCLDKLQERLSSHSTPERVVVPQRSMVSKQPVENTSGPTNNKIVSGLLPDSQPIAIGWEDPTESAEKAKMMNSSPTSVSEESPVPPRHKFVLSNVEEREKYESVLKTLGESVGTGSFYDPETTHLILDKPIRSEKLLCCLAAGKWVLNTNYVIESEKQNKLLPEEDYEWGNPRSKTNIPQYEPGTTEYQLACAVYRWRTKLKPGEGAFKGMKVVLVLSSSRIESFERLIIAGGGEVLPTSSILDATHCFVDYAKVSLPVELSLLVKHKIPCLPPIYVGEFLIKHPPPQPQDAFIPEYKRLLHQQ